ncbi:MAG TPA: hypothetical protein DIW15_03340 [Bavariicoccus seileri]|uniref:Glycosyltransferase RgtA/B/C/D-like domain-containing protein n=1 Tax=Bavariicoccus seileri TaxID=549685 RepID=A0A3D4S4S5_9ENTE|nr:hypothetical protein [Bavariicoccus seileri]HCS93730.1 hypothetical protein [Bavariicoccus seileri]
MISITSDTKKKLSYFVVFCLFVINLMTMAYFCSKKEGYFIDEMYTMSLSNSTEGPFIIATDNKYYADDYLNDALTVQDGEQFNYKSVYMNQVEDVHPPLYYFLYHTLASFFPNQFTKWIGLSLNLGILSLTWIVLFLLIKLVTHSSAISALGASLFGFSVGAMNSVIYIRMYALMTLFVVIVSYFHVRLIYKKDYRLKTLLGIFLFTYLGIMTQYYFLVFSFFLTFSSILVLWLRKKIRFSIKYGGAVLGSVGLSVITFPAMIKHLTTGDRGAEASSSILHNLSNYDLMKSNMTAFSHVISDGIFVSHLKNTVFVLITLLVISTLVCVYRKQVKTNLTTTSVLAGTETIIVFLATSLLYLFLIAQISPYKVDRYVMPLFPILLTISFLSFLYACKISFTNKKVTIIVLTLLVVVSSFMGISRIKLNYLYPEKNPQKVKQLFTTNYNDSIFIYNQELVPSGQISEMAQLLYYANDFYSFDLSAYISHIKENKLDTQDKVIFMGYGVDKDETTRQILDGTNFTSAKQIKDYPRVYLFNVK